LEVGTRRRSNQMRPWIEDFKLSLAKLSMKKRTKRPKRLRSLKLT